jgi:aryl-alcohol dehydrogenase-like predicted oxidoreductase
MSDTPISVSSSGKFKLAGEVPITRLGYGAMRITGPGIWGPPDNPGEALRVLQTLPELGIDFIDTADSYGPDVSEQLIREALHPYKNVFVAQKNQNGVTTAQTSNGGKSKTKNGKGVYTRPGGKTCMKTAANHGCN